MKLKKPLPLKAIVITALALVTFAAGLFASDLFGWFLPSFTNETSVSASTIEESLHELSELVTLSYHYREIGSFSDQRMLSMFGTNFPIPFGRRSFIITYSGEMKLGINMREASVEVLGSVVFIRLPEAHIISHTVFEDSVELLDETSGLFNRISITDYTNFIIEQKEVATDRALNSGLLVQARENAETQIRTLLSALPNMAEYEIRFLNS